MQTAVPFRVLMEGFDMVLLPVPTEKVLLFSRGAVQFLALIDF
jgi:hypothetical protein